MRSSLRCLLFILAAIVLYPAPAVSGPDFPAGFPSEFPLFQGCEVIQVMTMEGNDPVLLDCGSTPLEDISGFYSAAAKDAGWEMLMETKTPEGVFFLVEKGEKAFQVQLGTESGTTQGGLTYVSKQQ